MKQKILWLAISIAIVLLGTYVKDNYSLARNNEIESEQPASNNVQITSEPVVDNSDTSNTSQMKDYESFPQNEYGNYIICEATIDASTSYEDICNTLYFEIPINKYRMDDRSNLFYEIVNVDTGKLLKNGDAGQIGDYIAGQEECIGYNMGEFTITGELEYPAKITIYSRVDIPKDVVIFKNIY